MRSLGRLLQAVGLAIPPLAMVAQLSERIGAGQMLQFLLAAVIVFGIGYVLQLYGGGSK